MRGLTAEEYAMLIENSRDPRDIPVLDPPETAIEKQLFEDGRLGEMAVFVERFKDEYDYRPITPQGRLALEMWPRVRKYFEGQ